MRFFFASMLLQEHVNDLPEISIGLFATETNTFREIRYEESNQVGYLYFDFYNGAMSTEQCLRLCEAIIPERFEAFDNHVKFLTEALACSREYAKMLDTKQAQRNRDEFIKPLAAYRKTELQQNN